MQFDEQEVLKQFRIILEQITEQNRVAAQTEMIKALNPELTPLHHDIAQLLNFVREHAQEITQVQNIATGQSEQIQSVLSAIAIMKQDTKTLEASSERQQEAIERLMQRMGTNQVLLGLSIVLNVILLAVVFLR